MAELHIIGQIQSGSEFGETGLFCKWSVSAGNAWKKIAGNREGQTQVDTPTFAGSPSKWAHPIDLHFVSKSLQGWPKLIVEVCRQDQFGRSDLAGYGVCHIPSSPGQHIIEIPTWRPAGTLKDEVQRFFLGGSPELTESDLIVNPLERYRLKTIPSGIVQLEIGIIIRNFDKFGVEF